MSLFKRSKPEENPTRTSLGLLDLQARMETLERKMRDIETDWASQYEKFHRLNMRLAKRQKMLEEREDGAEETPENRPRGPNGKQRDMNPLAKQLLSRGRFP